MPLLSSLPSGYLTDRTNRIFCCLRCTLMRNFLVPCYIYGLPQEQQANLNLRNESLTDKSRNYHIIPFRPPIFASWI